MTNDTPYISRFQFNLSPRLVALLLFLISLAPRLPGLNLFLTSDENTNIFFAGSNVIAAVLQGNLRGTYWHFYPGVTMSWLDTLGMGGQYLLDTIFGRALPPFNEYIYGDILSLLVANRLPYAILTAANVSAMYLLARKLLPNRVALPGTLFMAFDPFYLAHSRVAHGDAPVAVFMSLSILTFFIYAQQVTESDIEKKQAHTLSSTLTHPYLIASAVLGSLAALTKGPGQFMAPFIIGLSILYAILQIRQTSRLTYHVSKNIIIHWFSVIIVWGLISLLVFILLWPSMWIDPVGTIRQMLNETFGKVNEGHLVYFFGQPTLNPGPWFYLYVIPFRMTPIILIGTLFSLLGFIPKLKSLIHLQSPNRQALISPLPLLWLFTISLLILATVFSPKKQDRYLLPLFPFLNLLAAIGWFGLLSLITHQLATIKSRFSASYFQFQIFNLLKQSDSPISLPVLIILILHVIPIFTYYPYYLTYFNPLMGGPAQASQTTLIGWGEGMEQAAAYLNTKPNAKNLYVASTPSQTLLPYFKGTGENFYTNDIALRADYVVLYIAQMQRLAPSPEIVRYFEAQQPEKTITIKDIPYAKIYPGPKFILSDIPPDATPLNIGLENKIRLAGYKIRNPKSKIQNLTLYWHALTPLPTNYTISIRVKTIDGRLLAQQDQWPVNGLLPTSQWRQDDYVADTHTLEISPTDIIQIGEFEIVVYNAETNQTLGSPITINNNL